MKRGLLAAGITAPDYTLRDLKGVKHSLHALAAEKPTVFAFFKASCPVCQMTFPFLQRMAASSTHQFVGISQDHLGTAQSFNSKFGVKFRTLLDEETAGYPASNGFGISHVPTAFLVEPDGEISWVMEGFSKSLMNELGTRVGVEPFTPGEYVPEWKSG